MLWALGDLAKTESIYKNILDIRQKNLPSDDPDIVNSFSSLRQFLPIVWTFKFATTILEKAYTQAISLLSEESSVLLYAIEELVALYIMEGKNVEVEPLFLEILDIQVSRLGDEHVDVLRSKETLGKIYCSIGDFDKAIELQEAVLAIRRKLQGHGHLNVASSLYNLSLTYEQMGSFKKVFVFVTSPSISRQSLGAGNPWSQAIEQDFLLLQNKVSRARQNYFTQGSYQEKTMHEDPLD